jgi:hypothetical protein
VVLIFAHHPYLNHHKSFSEARKEKSSGSLAAKRNRRHLFQSLHKNSHLCSKGDLFWKSGKQLPENKGRKHLAQSAFFSFIVEPAGRFH